MACVNLNKKNRLSWTLILVDRVFLEFKRLEHRDGFGGLSISKSTRPEIYILLFSDLSGPDILVRSYRGFANKRFHKKLVEPRDHALRICDNYRRPSDNPVNCDWVYNSEIYLINAVDCR